MFSQPQHKKDIGTHKRSLHKRRRKGRIIISIVGLFALAIAGPAPIADAYTVKRGDTLWSLARQYNTSVERLARANHIQNPDLIFTGQKIRVRFGSKVNRSKARVSNSRPVLCRPPRGQLRVPVSPSRVSQGFHGGHPAIDLAGPSGSVVRSIAAGRVATVRHWTYSYGKHVVVNHPCGQSLSAHLAGTRVNTGQKVRRGQVIGVRGSTGNSTGSHLHLEIRKNGRHVSPGPYIW